jgi:Transposase domain (DUF772)
MTHIAGFERDQLLLLPEAVDDYVDADNPVRFIDAFVDGLDLATAGFARVAAKATGRPGYAPVDLLKLYVYGYLNRVRSSRRLEREAHRNIEVIWLLRGLKPDFKTIAARTASSAFKNPPPSRAAPPSGRRRHSGPRPLVAFGACTRASAPARWTIGRMKSREEQLTWAKQRALICVDVGHFSDAVAGLRADLDENP